MRDVKLAKRLIKLSRADQAMRINAQNDESSWDYSLDKINTVKLKKILDKYGWPTIPLVGAEASNAAWLIVQHADHDLAFQEDCLKILKRLPKSDIKITNIAYLEDRVLIARGRPQLYGTQFQGTGKNLRPQPIKDAAKLDMRRRAMGLDTFDDYKKMMDEYYGHIQD